MTPSPPVTAHTPPPEPARPPGRDRRRRAALPRRAALALGIAVLITVAGVTVAQVRTDRAAAATGRAVTAAATARTAADVLAAGRAEADVLAIERLEHARATEVALRTAADEDLTARIAAADDVLTSSEHKVADDAVRQSLAAAIDAARATLAAAQPAAPPADLMAAGRAVDAARAAVEAAMSQRHAQADAAPAAPASTPAVPVWVTSIPTADGDGSNGHMPASAMCLIPWGTDQIGSPQYLRCDAADALTRLNDAFRVQFGEPIAMDLTYRSYQEQVAIRAYYGALAARPGTSNHGLGLALDVQEWPDVYGFATAQYAWLVANSPTFGWVAPASVRQDAAYPEYWHFEYRP